MAQPHRYQFEVHGTALAANLFAPARGRPRACAVLTGPLTRVKEQAAGAYAAALAERGFLVLAFDHRTFGESGGKPRQFENPFTKVEDIKAAAAALLSDPGPANIALIGIGVCAGGGYMARGSMLAARSKVVVGRRMTRFNDSVTYPELVVQPDAEAAGATWVQDAPVVVDRNLARRR